LPDKLRNAISEKLEEEQRSLKMKFVLLREAQEAERKKIEAKGIRSFQQIVSEGITQDLLRWKGIEATEGLAKSPNAKVVVIGSGKDGLPLILGGAN
jgi:regulator of protease activity HflC (stomatin/prohibitin superfamily)